MALGLCATLGFTIANTSGTEDIKPKVLGMRGREVDFNAVQASHPPNGPVQKKRKRVDLGEVADEAQGSLVTTRHDRQGTDDDEFIKLNVGQGQDHEALSYNHKLRRKLRRALDRAQVQKEMLVRQRAIDYLKSNGMDPPAELTTNTKPNNIRGSRILENGATETAKQERVRARVELAEFNQASRVLRKQAKQCAIETGLRKHAALTGRLPLDKKSANADGFSLPAHIAAAAAAVPALAAPADNRRDGEGAASGRDSEQSSTESNDYLGRPTGSTSPSVD